MLFRSVQKEETKRLGMDLSMSIQDDIECVVLEQPKEKFKFMLDQIQLRNQEKEREKLRRLPTKKEDLTSSQIAPSNFESPLKMSAIHAEDEEAVNGLDFGHKAPGHALDDSEDELKLVVENLEADEAYLDGENSPGVLSVSSEFGLGDNIQPTEIDPNDDDQIYLFG